ncbi:MAG TPA: glycosyltransferase [Novosphingobium sp.]|nr:glycosyltransferase [Novosphingobium sp.]
MNDTASPLPTLAFYRNYQAFQGGHLKVADYIAHTQASGLFAPVLHLSANSRPDHPFPQGCLTPHWYPRHASALFLAGMDWAQVPAGIEEEVPVVNLIQHTRHADRQDPRFAFLSRRAIRICVSEQVAQALRATGQVNGPVLTIPAAIDETMMPAPRMPRQGVVIAGLKHPDLALDVTRALAARGIAARAMVTPLARAAYLERIASARIAITLPDPAEGFYLPALEAMAAGCAVICPDAVGNRQFCRDEQTCLMPSREPDALAGAARRLIADPHLAHRLATAGKAEAQRYSMAAERGAFAEVLRMLAA